MQMKRHFEDADTKVHSFKNWTLVSITVKNTFSYSLCHAQLKGIQNLFNICLKSSPRSPLEDFDLENGYSAVIKDSKSKKAEDWPNLWPCASKVACHQSSITYCCKKHIVLVNVSTGLVLSSSYLQHCFSVIWCCLMGISDAVSLSGLMPSGSHQMQSSSWHYVSFCIYYNRQWFHYSRNYPRKSFFEDQQHAQDLPRTWCNYRSKKLEF